MAEFFWDFAFNFAAEEDSRIMSVLPNGPVQNGLPSSAQSFQLDDTLTFNIFNLTANASLTDGTLILGSKITFNSALVGQANTNPFTSSITVHLGAADAMGASAIFGPNVQLPRWTGTAQQIFNQGQFAFTVALIIQDHNNNVRTFVADPEMIVGGTN